MAYQSARDSASVSGRAGDTLTAAWKSFALSGVDDGGNRRTRLENRRPCPGAGTHDEARSNV